MSFHTSRKGENVKCEAPPGRCPLGGDHYETKEEADSALESRMSDSMFTPGDSARVKVDPAGMRLSELNQAVKNTEDSEVISEGIARGSERTHKNMVKNSSLTSDQLKELRDTSDSDEVRKSSLNHQNFSPANMTPDEFADVAARRQNGASKLLADDSVDDAKLEAYMNHPRVRNTSSINAALENPNNKLSHDKVLEHGSESWTSSGSAISSGRLSSSDIANLPERSVYWGSVSRERNPESLDGYASWATREKNESREMIGRYVAQNENTRTESLDKLGKAGVAAPEVYSNPKTSDSVRKELRESNPNVARKARLMDLEREHGDLKKQIVTESNTTRPYSGATYSTTHVQLDKKRIDELELSRDEVNDLMGARGYNAGSSYDPATGKFVGKIDSSG